ncbi:hypothetical protein [Cohnella cellulosilytica]|uniref:Carrier domain-containing protein n=1 Tax=Cohnella cellulosilytica TaxID=986710 RepID=A0ABW2FE67_9BACL
MLTSVKQFVNNLIQELNKGIVIESEVMYGDAKLEYALSIEDFMASISVLSDLTYDYFAGEIESEEIKLFKTKQFTNRQNLFNELREDVLSFSNMKKK